MTPDNQMIEMTCDNVLFLEFSDLQFIGVVADIVTSYFWRQHTTVGETAWEDGNQETWVLVLAV